MTKNKIGVVGLGYVGLPLAIRFSGVYDTVGYDINKKRVDELNNGFDSTLEVSTDQLESNNLLFSSDTDDILDCNFYVVTVPTPVDSHNIPDLNPLKLSSEMIGKILKAKDIVIYESTVYPGATEEVCVPILENVSKLKYNKDFFCGYSPERINPGDKEHSIDSITKVTAGSNRYAADIVDELYNSIITAGTYKVSSIRVAEAAKVIENIQRDVNIALVNELSILFHKMDINTNEVINAAKTKWNFIPFYPGFVGGHCIGVDPYYLTHKAKEYDYHPEIILSGRRINDNMDKFVYDCAIDEMVKNNINPIGAKVGIFGMTFKENCPDLRNTKVPKLVENFSKHGCLVDVFDPIAEKNVAKNLYDIELSDSINAKKYNLILIAVAHNEFKSMLESEWTKLLEQKSGIIMDVKSMFSVDFFSKSKVTHWQL